MQTDPCKEHRTMKTGLSLRDGQMYGLKKPLLLLRQATFGI